MTLIEAVVATAVVAAGRGWPPRTPSPPSISSRPASTSATPPKPRWPPPSSSCAACRSPAPLGQRGATCCRCVFPHADAARDSADATYSDTALARSDRPARSSPSNRRRAAPRPSPPPSSWARPAASRRSRSPAWPATTPGARACCPRRRCSCASRSTGAAARVPGSSRALRWSRSDPARPTHPRRRLRAHRDGRRPQQGLPAVRRAVSLPPRGPRTRGARLQPHRTAGRHGGHRRHPHGGVGLVLVAERLVRHLDRAARRSLIAGLRPAPHQRRARRVPGAPCRPARALLGQRHRLRRAVRRRPRSGHLLLRRRPAGALAQGVELAHRRRRRRLLDHLLRRPGAHAHAGPGRRSARRRPAARTACRSARRCCAAPRRHGKPAGRSACRCRREASRSARRAGLRPAGRPAHRLHRPARHGVAGRARPVEHVHLRRRRFVGAGLRPRPHRRRRRPRSGCAGAGRASVRRRCRHRSGPSPRPAAPIRSPIATLSASDPRPPLDAACAVAPTDPGIVVCRIDATGVWGQARRTRQSSPPCRAPTRSRAASSWAPTPCCRRPRGCRAAACTRAPTSPAASGRPYRRAADLAYGGLYDRTPVHAVGHIFSGGAEEHAAAGAPTADTDADGGVVPPAGLVAPPGAAALGALACHGADPGAALGPSGLDLTPARPHCAGRRRQRRGAGRRRRLRDRRRRRGARPVRRARPRRRRPARSRSSCWATAPSATGPWAAGTALEGALVVTGTLTVDGPLSVDGRPVCGAPGRARPAHRRRGRPRRAPRPPRVAPTCATCGGAGEPSGAPPSSAATRRRPGALRPGAPARPRRARRARRAAARSLT